VKSRSKKKKDGRADEGDSHGRPEAKHKKGRAMREKHNKEEDEQERFRPGRKKMGLPKREQKRKNVKDTRRV